MLGESGIARGCRDKAKYALNWSCTAKFQSRPDLAVGKLLGSGALPLACRRPGATGQPSVLKERETKVRVTIQRESRVGLTIAVSPKEEHGSIGPEDDVVRA